MPAKLLEFPSGNVRDVPRGLRELANRIEGGNYGDAHTLAWVVDCGDGRLEIGLLGSAAEAGVTAYYMYGVAMRRLESGVGHERN